ncbi:MAG: hypothetical protein JWR58_5156 [Pseudonocardia sp.]|nr:hypothetical protein [Pseudonocardia sp.]
MGPDGGTGLAVVAPHSYRPTDPERSGPAGTTECSREVLPHRIRARVLLGSRVGAAGGRGARPGGQGAGRGRRAGPGHQHQALSVVRSQLRVPLGGPVAVRDPRRRAGRGDPEPGRRRFGQAFRGEQPGDGPADGECGGGRAHAPGDLSGRLRARGHPGAPVDGDVRLQQDQRYLCRREPVAAQHGTARRMGLRRAGGLGLGRGARPGGRARRGAGPGDAARPRRQRCCRRSRRAGRRARGGRPGSRGGPGTPAGRPRHGAVWAPCRGRRRRTPRTGQGGGGRLRGAAEERGRSAAAPACGGRRHRGDRRVRPYTAVPGFGQLAGQPHRRRRGVGRVGHRGSGRCGGGVRRRVRDRHRRP